MNIRHFTTFLAAAIFMGMLIFPEKCISTGYDCLLFCGRVIVPSLLPFFICIKIFTRSGIAEFFGRRFDGVMRCVFNLPGTAAFAFFLGAVSGFPAGAKCAAEIYKNGSCSKDEAERIICFCNNASPIFVTGTIGGILYGNKAYGIILYTSHILSAIIVGIILGASRRPCTIKAVKSKAEKSTAVFADAVTDGVNSILYVVGTILFFNIFIGILQVFGVFNSASPTLKSVICAMLEMTSGVAKISALGGNLKLPITSFVLGFGGVCVILQIGGICEQCEIGIKKLVLSRLMQGTISMIVTCIMLTAKSAHTFFLIILPFVTIVVYKMCGILYNRHKKAVIKCQ